MSSIGGVMRDTYSNRVVKKRFFFTVTREGASAYHVVATLRLSSDPQKGAHVTSYCEIDGRWHV